jgi:hypothetical protein
MVTIDEKIEIRALSPVELGYLISEAPPSETKFLREFKKEYGLDVADFLKRYALFNSGMVANGRPIYMAAIIKSSDGRYEFWTVVNKDVKEMISLCKYSKRMLKEILKDFGTIYATMEKVSPKNMKWVEWLGFKKIDENKNIITYKLGA